MIIPLQPKIGDITINIHLVLEYAAFFTAYRYYVSLRKHTDNIWISGFALLVFVAIMTWSLTTTYMSRNVEHKVKRLAWIGLIPLLVVIFSWLSRWELW